MERLEKQKEEKFDIEKINVENLMDISSVKIDDTLSKEEKIKQFLKQIKNPYLCKCGDMIIHSVFSDTDVTLEERVKQYLKMM